MNRKNKRQYVDDEDIIVYDSTDDEFDDDVSENSSSENAEDEIYKDFEKHEIWDEVDGEWFTTYLRKGSVVPTDETIEKEANAWPVTVGVVIGIVAIIALAIGVSYWLYL